MTFKLTTVSAGELIRSADWNDAMKEIDRLGKLDWKETERAIAGPLTIQCALQGDEDKAALTVNGSGAKSLLTIKNNGAVELNGPLTVSQKLTVSQNLEVQGELSGPLTDPNKKLTVSGDLEILGKATSQKLTVSQNLEVQGELSGPLTEPNKKLTVSGALEVSGKATFKGDMSLGDQDQDKLTIAGTLQSQHSSGALQVADALHVTENLTIDGNVGIGTTETGNYRLNVAGGNINLNGNITIGGKIGNVEIVSSVFDRETVQFRTVYVIVDPNSPINIVPLFAGTNQKKGRIVCVNVIIRKFAISPNWSVNITVGATNVATYKTQEIWTKDDVNKKSSLSGSIDLAPLNYMGDNLVIIRSLGNQPDPQSPADWNESHGASSLIVMVCR